MPTRPLAVAVLSPQPIVRHGLVGLLGKHPGRVTVVPFPDDAVGSSPDVVLYDVLLLLHRDGVDLGDLATSASGRVLALSRDLRPELVARAIALGADGSCSIGASEDELLAAVEAVGRGESPDAPSVPPGPRPGAQVGLTEREVQVLTLIAQGHTNQEIARTLFLSPNSIKTYVRTAYRKIGAASRSQAVSWAIRNGFPSGEREH
jgi:DNA-binding NarL/FixJ family response regulator